LASFEDLGMWAFLYEQTEESSNVGGHDIDILRPSAMTFVGAFDESGSDRVKRRRGGDIHDRNVFWGQVQQFYYEAEKKLRWTW